MREDSDNHHCVNCGQEYQPSCVRLGLDMPEQSIRSCPDDLCPECAPDCRRPLNRETLPEAADYLRRHENLRETLRAALSDRCLYYPGAGQDIDPALLFGNNRSVSTVVYVDYLAKSSRHHFRSVFDKFERPPRETHAPIPVNLSEYAKTPLLPPL